METVLLDGKVRLIQANALSIPLEDESVNCCVTSPPYWGLRDYLGAEDQLGLEKTPEEYVAKMVQVFREVKRVLKNDGTLWLNVGDSYAAGKSGRTDHGSSDPTCGLSGNTVGAVPPGPVVSRKAPPGFKSKDLVGIPWMLAFALRADGWYLRQDIIWHKPNPMPESVRDRCTKAHEYIFLLSKSPKYYFDNEAVKEPAVTNDLRRPYAPGQIDSRGDGHARGGGKLRKDKQGELGKRTYTGFNERWDNRDEPLLKRNKRDVWTVATRPYPGSHFATFPPDLIEPCILAGCPVNGIVLDPFGGSGTTGRVAVDNGRRAVLLDINYKDGPDSYLDLARDRILSPARKKTESRIKEKINEDWLSLLEVTV